MKTKPGPLGFWKQTTEFEKCEGESQPQPRTRKADQGERDLGGGGGGWVGGKGGGRNKLVRGIYDESG